MNSFQTGSSLFALIRMLYQTSPTSKYVLVEGQEDVDLVKYHIHSSDVQLIISGGKSALIEAIVILEAAGFSEAIGVVDRDFDHLVTSTIPRTTNLIHTDGYDLFSEMFAINPSLIRDVLFSLDSNAATNIESLSGERLENLIIQLVLCLAPFRIINGWCRLQMKFANFPFGDIINSDFTPGENKNVLAVLNRRSSTVTKLVTIHRYISSVNALIAPSIRDCGGHDLIGAATALMIRGGAKNFSKDALKEKLIGAIDCSIFSGSTTSNLIETWARTHSMRIFDCC